MPETGNRLESMSNSDALTLAVLAADSTSAERARKIAREFSLPLVRSSDLAGLEYVLCVSDDGARLKHTQGLHGSLSIDFTSGRAAHRRRFGGGRRQPLARAVGIGKPGIQRVVDATAGFGGDGFVLASLGCEVVLLERQPALAVMLTEALARAKLDPDTAAIASRMRFEHVDATLWLSDERRRHCADTVYLDPMYPEINKRALAKKNMQALQRLAGPDIDSEHLLNAALTCAARRVVVKRPASAQSLTGRLPDTSVSSPNTRYDVYLVT